MRKMSAQGICLMFAVVLIFLWAMAWHCWAGEKEEYQANLKALTWEFQFMQERAKMIQIEAQAIQAKLTDLDKKEAEKKAKEKKDEKIPAK